MLPSFTKPSAISRPDDAVADAKPARSRVVERVASVAALWAIAFWMGGLLALGALAAPVVFAVVPLPASADAMTVVFRRFDVVAMACAAVVLATEGLRAAAARLTASDRVRCAVSAFASAVAVFEGAFVSPRIAELHFQGVLRGAGDAGLRLSKLHDLAEACGQAQLAALAVIVALHVLTLSSAATYRASSVANESS